MGPTGPKNATNQIAFLETTNPKIESKLHCDVGMSCLDQANTANFGYRKFTAKNHSNPSLIQFKHGPDDVRAGLWLPTDSLMSSWLECLCNSIAVEQALPVMFVCPIFHNQTHCAHSFGSFVWYTARFPDNKFWTFLGVEGTQLHVMSSWAVLKSSFISQGRKELLTPPLTPHLRGHSASLHDGIPVFCLRRLMHLRVLLTHTFLWPPPVLPHEGGL